MADTEIYVKGVQYQKVVEIHPDSKYILICNISPESKDAEEFIRQMHSQLLEWMASPDQPLFTIFTDDTIRVELKKVLDRGGSDKDSS